MKTGKEKQKSYLNAQKTIEKRDRVTTAKQKYWSLLYGGKKTQRGNSGATRRMKKMLPLPHSYTSTARGEKNKSGRKGIDKLHIREELKCGYFPTRLGKDTKVSIPTYLASDEKGKF